MGWASDDDTVVTKRNALEAIMNQAELTSALGDFFGSVSRPHDVQIPTADEHGHFEVTLRCSRYDPSSTVERYVTDGEKVSDPEMVGPENAPCHFCTLPFREASYVIRWGRDERSKVEVLVIDDDEARAAAFTRVQETFGSAD